MMFPIAILAGGLATRLRPLTVSLPKALVDINGEPFIAHQLRLLAHHNFKKVILCVGYLGEMIQEFVKDGKQFKLEVDYSFDGEPLLGTAGALKRALPSLGNDFFVMYGDSYLPCDFQAVQKAFQKSGKTALMTIFRNDGQWDKSNVEFNGKEILVYDKKNITPNMHHIDYGLGTFNSTAFSSLRENESYDLAELYQSLLKQQQLAAYEVSQRFYETGSFSGMKELKTYLSQQH